MDERAADLSVKVKVHGALFVVLRELPAGTFF
jgi:hypothetical protein